MTLNLANADTLHFKQTIDAISRIIEGKTLGGDIPTLIDVKFIMIALQKQYNKNSPYTEYEKIVKEAKGYKADAERYRWLRDNGCIFWTDLGTNKEVKHQVCEQAMDDVVDNASKESKK